MAQSNAATVVAEPEKRRNDPRRLGGNGDVVKRGRAFLARRIGIALRHQEPFATEERYAEYRDQKRRRPAERVRIYKSQDTTVGVALRGHPSLRILANGWHLES